MILFFKGECINEIINTFNEYNLLQFRKIGEYYLTITKIMKGVHYEG